MSASSVLLSRVLHGLALGAVVAAGGCVDRQGVDDGDRPDADLSADADLTMDAEPVEDADLTRDARVEEADALPECSPSPYCVEVGEDEPCLAYGTEEENQVILDAVGYEPTCYGDVWGVCRVEGQRSGHHECCYQIEDLCVGRPFRVGGASLRASATRRGDWL